MSYLKKILRRICKEYDLYWIYENPPDIAAVPIPAGFEFAEISSPEEIRSSAPEINSLRSYLLEDSRCFAIRKENEIVSACIYWWGQTYVAQRNFWKLQPNEAKLVQINTVPSCRGLGLASALISNSAIRMRESAFQRLFARIWHSNTSSIRAFEKAKWRRVAFRGRFLIPLFGERSFTRHYKR